MAIFGIKGAIGSGKTLTLAYLTILDLKDGKEIYTNIIFKGLEKNEEKRIHHLTKDFVINMFNQTKKGFVDMKNSTIAIQEIHLYMDSRRSMSEKNQMLSYWILQSRHTGEGSCNIMYDTQNLDQIDKRLRRSTDYLLIPNINKWIQIEDKHGKIKKIPIELGLTFLTGYDETSSKRFKTTIDISEVITKYDTHQIVDF